MKRWNNKKSVGLAGLSLALVSLGGCMDYQIETTLNADGSGSRDEKLTVTHTDDSETDLTADEFARLGNVTEGDGWSHQREVQGRDTAWVFRRAQRVRNLAAWADLSGSVHITGATARHADERVGYVRLGDVHFRNEVRVETGRAPGGRTYSYRETFYWTDALDALVELFMETVDSTVKASYPGLPTAQVDEIVGMARGQLWAALDQGLLGASGDDEDRLTQAMVDRTATQAAKIARRYEPDADEAAFRAMLSQLFADEDDRVGQFISEKLTGLELAGSAQIVLHLKMPGRVTETNADERDGDTLVWTVDPSDALRLPIEIFAESVVSE